MTPPPCFKIGQPLNPCAKALHTERAEGRADLPPEHWHKWKIRGQYLIGPGGMRFTARTLRAAWDGWVKKQENKSGRPGGHAPPANDTDPEPKTTTAKCALRSNASALITLHQEPHE